MFSGADGRILFSIDGDSPGDEFGYSVGGAGDVDRDGYHDFIVGSPIDGDNGPSSGSARVYSGRNGSVLWRFDGVAAGDLFGHCVSGAGDVDGYADVIVGARYQSGNAARSGCARVFSGKDGTILYTFCGDSAGDQFGESVGAAGDVDRDGHADVIVGAPADDDFGADSGSARVLSGRDGSTLYTFFGDSADDQLGISVSGAGDVNRDSYPDLLVAAWNDDLGGLDTGSVRVYSGLDGSVLHTFVGDQPRNHLGWRVSRAGDVDGDGFDDVMSGKGFYDTLLDRGYTRVWSGRDGSVLRRFEGFQVGGGEDITGDGVPDLLAGTAAHASAANFVNFRGVLDSAGRATASVYVPPLLPLPFTLHHVLVVHDDGDIYLASNPVSVRVE